MTNQKVGPGLRSRPVNFQPLTRKREISKLLSRKTMAEGSMRFSNDDVSVLKVTIAIIGFMISFGCTHVQLDAPNRTKIRSVFVDKEIKIPDHMLRFNQSETIGMLGVAGFVLSESLPKDPRAALMHVMERDRISIPAIVHEEFAGRLRARNLFEVANERDVDAAIKVEIRFYGFANSSPNQLKPALALEATMFDKEGKILWRNRDYVGPLNKKVPSNDLRTYLSETKKIEQDFRIAASTVTDLLLDDIPSQ